MDERLEPQVGDRGPNRANVVERVFAREHDAGDADLLEHRGAALVVHRHLRRSVNLERRKQPLNQAHEPQVLHDGGVDPEIDRLAEQQQRVDQFRGLREDVQREVDALAALVGEPAGFAELLHA